MSSNRVNGTFSKKIMYFVFSNDLISIIVVENK